MPDDAISRTFLTDRTRMGLERLGQVIYNQSDHYLLPEEFGEEKNCDIFVSLWGAPKFDRSYQAVFPNLKLYVYFGASVVNIVDEAFFKRGIRIVSGNDIYARSVAEGCICYMLCALRNIEKYSGIVRNGGWKETNFYNRGLYGRSVGLAGFGAVSRHLTSLLKAFGASVMAYDKYRMPQEMEAMGVKPATAEELFSSCDIVSIHLPKTPETVKSIGSMHFRSMKEGALLVNTARGEILDEKALIAELATGRISAALDVFDGEIMDVCNPLRYLKNVLPIPHMAGPTIDMREETAVTLIEDIARFIQGGSLENEIGFGRAQLMTQ
jgi:phosphoglycerate dehydrogenase-like enzyme